MLDRFPVLDGLHPGLGNRLQALQTDTDDARWYALPYSVRWAPDIMQAYQLMLAAAEDMESEDPDFAAYLTLRARDIISVQANSLKSTSAGPLRFMIGSQSACVTRAAIAL